MLRLHLIFLALFCLTSCQEKAPIDLCALFAADQSNLSRKAYGDEANAIRQAKRMQTFEDNYTLLESLIKEKKLATLASDSCYHDFMTATLVHVAQNFPERLFKKSMIDSLSEEEKSGNLNRDAFGLIISLFKNYSSEGPCLKHKPMVDYAITKWRVDIDERNPVHPDDIDYEKCSP